MATRSFQAIDSEGFVVDASSPSMTPGSTIINYSSTPLGTIFTYNGAYDYELVRLTDTGGDNKIFEDDMAADHVIVSGGSLIESGVEVETESQHYVRQLDAGGNQVGPTITISVFSRDGNVSDVWGIAADYYLVPGERYETTGGSIDGTSVYSDFVPCFVAKTLIDTANGHMPVELLRPGDLVMTRDNGPCPIRWIGRNSLDAQSVLRNPKLGPIAIEPGALGQNRSHARFSVSPNHRLLVRPRTDSKEVLIPAKHLVGMPGITRSRLQPVTYVHLMFDRHQIIRSDGMWSESFLPGRYTMGALPIAQRREIVTLFPQLADQPQPISYPAARRILTAREVLQLAARTPDCFSRHSSVS